MNKNYLHWFSSLNDTILYYYDSVSTMIKYEDVREDFTRYTGSKEVNKGKDIIKTNIIVEFELTEDCKVEITKHTVIYLNDVERDNSFAVITLKNKESILDFMHENFFNELGLINIEDNSTEEDLTGIKY